MICKEKAKEIDPFGVSNFIMQVYVNYRRLNLHGSTAAFNTPHFLGKIKQKRSNEE